MGRPDRHCEPRCGRHRGCRVHRTASPRVPGSGWSETVAPESVPTIRCDPATASLAMLGGCTRFTNSTRAVPTSSGHRSGRRSPPLSPAWDASSWLKTWANGITRAEAWVGTARRWAGRRTGPATPAGRARCRAPALRGGATPRSPRPNALRRIPSDGGNVRRQAAGAAGTHRGGVR